MSDSQPRVILIDVDTQFDFIDPAGRLHVPADPSVDAAIVATLTGAREASHPILGSVDSHAWDAWEFEDNGGPFPPHCVKGTPGWLRVHQEIPARTRFVPMQRLVGTELANLVGENEQGAGNRALTADDLVEEAVSGVGIYLEKEVYSFFSNPAADAIVRALVERLGGEDTVRFDVFGYCTGGYCVDTAAIGLAERGYRVRVLAYATAAIGGAEGLDKSRTELERLGVEWVAAPGPAA